MRLILTVLSRSALSICVVAPALTQQFVHQNNLLPGPHRWTEGVTAEDVDLDGDLDLMFAEGDGFTSAGAQRQCRRPPKALRTGLRSASSSRRSAL